MRNIETSVGKAYAVTTPTECTITTPDGVVIAVCPPGQQTMFIAPTNPVIASVDEAHVTESFKSASPSAAGGGVAISFDDLPTAGSENAVTSNGVYVACMHKGKGAQSLAVGVTAKGDGYESTALGCEASSGGFSTSVGALSSSSEEGVAIGCGARSSGGVAIGRSAHAGTRGVAIGKGIKCLKTGVSVIGANTSTEFNSTKGVLQFYLIAAGTPDSIAYSDGEPAIAFTQHDTNNSLASCGVIKLTTLMTDHNIDSATPFS